MAAHVIDAPGASVVSGHARSLLSLLSTSAIPVTVTLPVFVTRYEYATVCGAISFAVTDDFATTS